MYPLGRGVKFIKEMMFQKRGKLFNHFLVAIFEPSFLGTKAKRLHTPHSHHHENIISNKSAIICSIITGIYSTNVLING
jgi:hypothetical protein